MLIEIEARSSIPKLGWLLNPRRLERRLRQLVRHGQLDVVVSHDWCGPSGAIRPGCPVVVWCNGSATYFSKLTGEPVRPRVRRAEERALKSSQANAAVSRFTAQQTQEVFGLKRRLQVIPNPVDVERFTPAEPDQVLTDSFVYVGTIVRKKGVLDLCQAFNEVVERRPEARLIVVGRDSRDVVSGASSTWALCLAQLSSAARQQVDYRGFVPYAEIEQLIKTCLAAVLPSYAEALPLSWMEVMACGRPVVAANVGWSTELIRPGIDGLLVEPGQPDQLAEAMIELLDDAPLATRLGQAARQRMVDDFSAQVVAERFATWLVEVTAR